MYRSSSELAKLKKLRKRARTDLFWLAKEVLGYGDLVERVHQPVCDFLVQKKQGVSLAQQDTKKERLILDPRGHFKTTIADVADAIQWILIDPNVRVLVMTGKRELATLILGEVVWHFENNPRLKKLFPEYKLSHANTEAFTVANRTRSLKEPTMMISSGESVKAGFHFDVIKCDDLVNETTVGTKEQIEKSINIWNYTTPLLEPYGYRDTIGTPYNDSDLYQWLQENKKSIAVFKRKVGTLVEEKGKFRIENIMFPERFSEEWLLEQHAADPYIFSCQYLCDPTPVASATFTEKDVRSHFVNISPLIRGNGRTFITWDIGYSQKEYADYSVGAVGVWDNRGRLIILDLRMGRFNPHQLLQHIFDMILKWKPARVGIEEANGSPLLGPAIALYQERLSNYTPIDWVKLKNVKGAKQERIASLVPLLKEDKLFFALTIPAEAREEMVRQMTRFPNFKHDDIPDAISMLLHYRTSVDRNVPVDADSLMTAPVMSDALGAGLVG